MSLVSLITVSKQVTTTITLDEDKTKTLYHLIEKCFEKAHDVESKFGLTTSEWVLFGRMYSEIEASGIINT
jgi:hypothetical protein